MPELEVTTKESRQTWQSPDGKITLFELTLEYEGKPVTAKTYSKAIATEGWTGTVETYEKNGNRGLETFVKQPPKEDSLTYPSGNSTQSAGSGYTPKDEKAIQAMWAIDKAKDLKIALGFPAKPVLDTIEEEIESIAQRLFLMVDRVKAVTEDEETEEAAPEEPTVTAEDIDKVFNKDKLGKLPVGGKDA